MGSIIELLLFIFALSLDTFFACFSYGTNKIRIPISSSMTMSSIGSIFLLISLYLGRFIKLIIPDYMLSYGCFAILFILGLVKLFDSTIKHYANRSLAFSSSKATFILQIYVTPTKADYDASHSLSFKEALSLAIALSLDSTSAGIGVAFNITSPLLLTLFLFITSFIMCHLGCFLGKKVSRTWDCDFSWIAGVLLIILAIIKLIP